MTGALPSMSSSYYKGGYEGLSYERASDGLSMCHGVNMDLVFEVCVCCGHILYTATHMPRGQATRRSASILGTVTFSSFLFQTCTCDYCYVAACRVCNNISP